jgi:hypothetical protein
MDFCAKVQAVLTFWLRQDISCLASSLETKKAACYRRPSSYFTQKAKSSVVGSKPVDAGESEVGQDAHGGKRFFSNKKRENK